jgi:hypothetical protein
MLAALLLGCRAAPAAAPPKTCDVTETLLDDGRCQPAGLPLDAPACPPGEAPLDGGGCLPAGVPPDACGDGFMSDGNGGCEAILPPAACHKGMMAVPGMTTCEDVAPCGAGTWGDIPVGATTQYVDQAYAGGGSDGSAAKPWTTIQEGIDAAGNGAIVAVAAGVYAENVKIVKQARLWGRCPALVEVAGPDPTGASILVLDAAANGAEVHDIGISGQGGALEVVGPKGVIIDRVWVHDSGGPGVQVLFDGTSATMTGSLIERATDVGVVLQADATVGGTVVRDIVGNAYPGLGIYMEPEKGAPKPQVTIRGSLVEWTHYAGIYAMESDAVIESTVVRDIVLEGDTQGKFGFAVWGIIADRMPGGQRTSVTVKQSVVERSAEHGIAAYSSDLTVEDTVVRDTESPTGANQPSGIYVVLADGVPDTANATIRSSLIDQNTEVGMLVFVADATIESTIIRGTKQLGGAYGLGLFVAESFSTGERSNVTLRSSIVDGNHGVGVAVSGSDALIESCAVQGTLRTNHSGAPGSYAVGIQISNAVTAAGQPSKATIRWSLIEDTPDVGLLVSGSEAVIESTTVRNTGPNPPGLVGHGIEIQPDQMTGLRSTATIKTCFLEENHEAGLFLDSSDATVWSTLVRATHANAMGQYGDGIVVSADSGAGSANVTLTKNRVEASDRAGLSNFGGAVAFSATALVCSAFDIEGETYLGSPFSFDDQGNNVCGCPDTSGQCKVLSASLMPPRPIGGM